MPSAASVALIVWATASTTQFSPENSRHPTLDRPVITSWEKVTFEPHGKNQGCECSGAGGWRIAYNYRVVEMVRQIMLDACIRLRRLMHRNQAEYLVIVASEHSFRNQAAPHIVVDASRQASNPVVRFVELDFVRNRGQCLVQQLVTGIGEINSADAEVNQSDPSEQQQVKEQGSAQSQAEMSVVDQRSASDAVVGKQEQFLGERGHESVRPNGGCVRAEVSVSDDQCGSLIRAWTSESRLLASAGLDEAVMLLGG